MTEGGFDRTSAGICPHRLVEDARVSGCVLCVTGLSMLGCGVGFWSSSVLERLVVVAVVMVVQQACSVTQRSIV